MRRRAQVVLGLVAALLPLTPRADAAVPALAGTTVVTGSVTGRLTVDLRAPATVDLGLPPVTDAPGASVSGDGRLTGAVLVRRGAGRGVTWLWASRAGLCSRPGCRPVHGGAFHAWGLTRDRRLSATFAELLAGRYDLYLLADGRPVTVTLRLRGVGGRATLRPRPLRDVLLWTPEPSATRLPDGSTAGTVSATRQALLPRAGLVHQQTWGAGAEHQHELVGCWAVQEPESSAPRSATPCPGPVDPSQPSGQTGGPGAGPPCPGACVVTGDSRPTRSGTLAWTWLDRGVPLHLGAQGAYRHVDGAVQVLTLVLPDT